MSITETIHQKAIDSFASASGTNRRETALHVAHLLRRFAGTKPANPGNQRTAIIAGEEYHWVELNGRLTLADGPSPWRAS